LAPHTPLAKIITRRERLCGLIHEYDAIAALRGGSGLVASRVDVTARTPSASAPPTHVCQIGRDLVFARARET
jgi:hypothetical protein